MVLDLTTTSGLEAYLAGTKFAAAGVQILAGGHSAYTYRVVMETPLENGATTVVVKHSFVHMKSDKSISVCQERMTFEHEALKMINESGLSTPESIVQVPQVLHYDPETYTLIMMDVAPADLIHCGKSVP